MRVGYFPNWRVDGAEGPFRIGPNQMVVVPTDTHVRLHFGRSKSDLFFHGLTLLGVVMAIALRIRGNIKYPQDVEVPVIATPHVRSISPEWAVEIAQWGEPPGEAPGLIRPQNRLE